MTVIERRVERVHDVLRAKGGLQDWTDDELDKLAREIVSAIGPVRSADTTSVPRGADEALRIAATLPQLYEVGPGGAWREVNATGLVQRIAGAAVARADALDRAVREFQTNLADGVELEDAEQALAAAHRAAMEGGGT